ncbi:MAG: DUF896 domain-containing protein [Lachnospiraceae bacterium]|nr:DUF896 domain-containing protein [Lachnospiraceae bacterium]
MATMEEKIARINELYHKSQTEAGLTPEEKCEQQKLRADYVASVRAALRGQLDSIDIEEKDGSVTNLGEKFGQNNKGTLN